MSLLVKNWSAAQQSQSYNFFSFYTGKNSVAHCTPEKRKLHLLWDKTRLWWSFKYKQMLELKNFTVSSSTFEKNCVKIVHIPHVLCTSYAGLVQKLFDDNKMLYSRF